MRICLKQSKKQVEVLPNSYRVIFLFLPLIFLIVNLADLVTTNYILATGGVELNPFLQYSNLAGELGLFGWFFKGSISATLFIINFYVIRKGATVKERIFVPLIEVLGIGFFACCVISNIHQIIMFGGL